MAPPKTPATQAASIELARAEGDARKALADRQTANRAWSVALEALSTAKGTNFRAAAAAADAAARAVQAAKEVQEAADAIREEKLDALVAARTAAGEGGSPAELLKAEFDREWAARRRELMTNPYADLLESSARLREVLRRMLIETDED